MKSIVFLFLSAFLCGTLSEPLRYRQNQQVEKEASGNQGTQNDDEKLEQDVTEPTIYQSVPAPYPPRGWLPIAGLTNGQLLVLPVAVRENLESTDFNDSEATEESSTTESQVANEQAQEVETSEPKTKPSAAHKRPGPTIIIIKNKKSGELKVESKQEAKQESAETNEDTTETTDDTVDGEKNNEEENKQMNNAQTGYFIQLPDGSLQRIVYVAPQTSQAQAQVAFVTQPSSVPFQQLNQAPNNPFGYNPITNPRIVTFSTQYNAK